MDWIRDISDAEKFFINFAKGAGVCFQSTMAFNCFMDTMRTYFPSMDTPKRISVHKKYVVCRLGTSKVIVKEIAGSSISLEKAYCIDGKGARILKKWLRSSIRELKRHSFASHNKDCSYTFTIRVSPKRNIPNITEKEN